MNLKLGNNNIDFFNKVNIKMKYDALASSFSLDTFFNPNNDAHKEIFKPGTYRNVKIEHNGELVLNGTLLSSSFTSTSNTELSNLGGYSLPGVLEDCQMPVENYPLQFDGLTLKEIAEKLVAPFGLTIVISSLVADDMNKVFDTSGIDAFDSIKEYLSEMTTQKNIILSHTPGGSLLFTRAVTKQQPLFQFIEGGIGFEKMTLGFNGQTIHSGLTILKDAQSDESNACQASIDNPYSTVVRPSVKGQNSGNDNDTFLTARMMLSKELKNISLKIDLDSWVFGGKLLRPNKIITVQNKEVYLYNKTNWFVEGVTLTGNEKRQKATLTCVLPEVYNNTTPRNIFN